MNKLVVSHNHHGDNDKYIRVGATTTSTSTSSAASEERATPSSISCYHLLQKKKKTLLTGEGGPSKSSSSSSSSKTTRRVRFLHDDDKDQEAVVGLKDTTTTSKGKPLFDILTDDICQRLWFTPTEVYLMRTQIRKLILFGSTTMKEGGEDDYAGLERFTDFERSKRKRAAIRLVLLEQMKGCSPDTVQQVAHAVSQDAVAEATIQGFHDFCQVYDPLEGLLGTINNDSSSIDDDGERTTHATYNETFFGELPLTTKKGKLLPLIQPQPQLQSQQLQSQLQKVLALPKSSNKLCNMKRKRIRTTSMILPAITGRIGCLDDDSSSSSSSSSHCCDPLLGKRRRIQQQHKIL